MMDNLTFQIKSKEMRACLIILLKLLIIFVSRWMWYYKSCLKCYHCSLLQIWQNVYHRMGMIWTQQGFPCWKVWEGSPSLIPPHLVKSPPPQVNSSPTKFLFPSPKVNSPHLPLITMFMYNPIISSFLVVVTAPVLFLF